MADSGEPTLVVDGDARPVGWAHSDRPGHVFPLGSTFTAESDTLRAALDSALTSPYGLAVAVAPGTGRFAGVVASRQILDQAAQARTTSDDAGAVDAGPVDDITLTCAPHTRAHNLTITAITEAPHWCPPHAWPPHA